MNATAFETASQQRPRVARSVGHGAGSLAPHPGAWGTLGAMAPRSEAPRSRETSVVVIALIALNVAVFLYEMILSGTADGEGSALADFVGTWGLVPREFLREIASPGATHRIIWFTPVSSMFVHAGLLHLAGNLLYLWVFGTVIEAVLGPRRFLALYLGCGLIAAAVQVASDPGSYVPAIGASGAVAGVLGAFAVASPRGRLHLMWPPIVVPAIFFLLVWIVIQVLSGVYSPSAEEGGAAWWAHLGGFAAGVALARWMRVRVRADSGACT